MTTLSSAWLDAFAAVARTGSFSKAAKQLFITQSALSQRIKQLEDELGLSVLERGSKQVTPTAAGHKLLAYCQTREALEADVRSALTNESLTLAGTLRIGGYSTVMQSLVLPTLAPLLREHPAVQLEAICVETRELARKLQSGACDLVIADRTLHGKDVTSTPLGNEEYVLTESKRHKTRHHVFLDHDDEDATSFRYLEKHGEAFAGYDRSFLGNIYALIDGVALGLGRGVIPRHLLDARLEVVPKYAPWPVPIVLHYKTALTRSPLHKSAIDTLLRDLPRRLQR